MGLKAKHIYEFGEFRLDASERLLFEKGEAVQLPPKVVDTLLALVERSGRLVEKDELMKLVWPDTYVEENNLNKNVSALRKALGEAGGEQKFIETIPKRGYRFVADVRELSGGETEVVIERSKSMIRIDEERETNEQESLVGAGAGPHALEVARVGAALSLPPHTEPGHWWKKRTTVIAFSALAVGLAAVVIVYLLTRGKHVPTAAAPPPPNRTIAVLPFQPISADARDEFLELGMADALITKLSNIRQVVVRPTSAIRKYAGLEQNPVAAGRELKVGAVLVGNVQKAGDRLRVTVQMINVEDGGPLWADKFDVPFTDIFSMQDSISEKVASALALRLTGEERKRIAKRYTESNEAYQLYQRGRYFLELHTPEANKRAIEYFEQAVVRDPSYALAHSGVADSYIQFGRGALALPEGAHAKAKAAAARALELDETLAEAHASLGFVRFHYDWDWQGAEPEFKRAIELNPNYAEAHHYYSFFLMAAGRLDEGLAESKRTVELNPVSLLANADLALGFMTNRQYDDALEQLRKTLELNPNYANGRLLLARVYLLKGMYDEAILRYEKAVAGVNDDPVSVSGLAQAYALGGRRADALRLLGELKAQSNEHRVFFYYVALVQAALGEREEAFETLEKSFAEREQALLYLKVEARLDSLRADQRFADLMRRVGIPQ